MYCAEPPKVYMSMPGDGHGKGNNIFEAILTIRDFTDVFSPKFILWDDGYSSY